MTLTWYRHFQRNGGMNKILGCQTSRFYYVFIKIATNRKKSLKKPRWLSKAKNRQYNAKKKKDTQ